MRIVFFTNEKFDSSERFRYMFANVAASFPDVHIVAVRRSGAQKKMHFRLQEKVRRVLWRARRFGVMHTLEFLTSRPLQFLIGERNWREVHEKFQALPRPAVEELQPEKAVYVETVNGPETVEAISGLDPDVVIQVDAGILRRQVFEIARIGTLNLHPGIAPLIRGQDPTYWALWERRREWMGATVHCIDEGIDTGPVLAYAPVEARYPGERFPSLLVRTHEVGTKHLVDALRRLEQGERWAIHPPRGECTYRTIFSGWKLLLLEIRLASERRRAAALIRERTKS